MSGRITSTFQNLRERKQGGFIAYVTAGDPSPLRTVEILTALERAGVDIIELGIPFSDPLADGPTIQAASGRALAAGMTVSKSLDAVREFRQSSHTPVVLFTYLNPIYTYGFSKFVADASAAGADGLLVLDMPHEEVAANAELLDAGGLDAIRLVAPTTPPARMEEICRTAQGFIYYVSREGVTGEQSSLADSIASQVAEIRRHSDLPVAVGFGISTTEQTSSVASQSDAAVVGSAIVRRIGEVGDVESLSAAVESFVAPLAAAAHSTKPISAAG